MAAKSMGTSVFLGNKAARMRLCCSVCGLEKQGLVWTQRLVGSREGTISSDTTFLGRMTCENIAGMESLHEW